MSASELGRELPGTSFGRVRVGPSECPIVRRSLGRGYRVEDHMPEWRSFQRFAAVSYRGFTRFVRPDIAADIPGIHPVSLGCYFVIFV